MNYNEPISLQDHSFRNLVNFFSSFSKYFCILGSGPASSVSLQPERVFVGECRLLFHIHKNGINVSNVAKEYPSISDGKEFDLGRYGSYTKLSKLLYVVEDALSLIGPGYNWLVSNEQSTELIEAHNQVDLLWLSNILDSALIDNSGTPIAFDEIPYLYKRLHQCEAPKWISVIITCSPLMKMYADELVSKCDELLKIMKDKRVFFQLSSAKWEELFKYNAICLFYRRNKLRLPILEFKSSYQSDYCDIDIALLGYEKIENLLNSRYLQTIEETNSNYVCLTAEGLQKLFQKQIVEILFNSEDYNIMVDSITSKYYNTYGYNLKLKEMDISKLNQLLSLHEISSLVSISGDKKEKCLCLKNEIIQREKCRQVLTDLSNEIKFPFKYELFSERYYTKFKEKCDIKLVYDSASQVVRVLGQNGCYRITSANYSYPHRKLSSIPKGHLLTPEHLVEHKILSNFNSKNKDDTSNDQACVPNYDVKTTTEYGLITSQNKNPKAPTSPSHSKNSGPISSVRILKRPKDYFDNKEKSHCSHPVTYKETVGVYTKDNDNNQFHDTASIQKNSLSENVLAPTSNLSTLSLSTVNPTNTVSRKEKYSPQTDTFKDCSLPTECVKDKISTNEVEIKSIDLSNKSPNVVGKSTSGFGEPDKSEVKGRICLAANFSLLDNDN
ncbi:hypothetical protein LOD99_13353 [Oopsacas minuta]|uniref:HTH OST-type domain-containing protein n=1 Tax=Oopsacas minuta TaxID=111878 RepID=A0AAV7KL22_9METZ|nr:hypothetical protein LOD99_13353 [Oopsacas minuta]